MSKAIGATGDESLKAEIGRNGLKRTGAPFRHPENADHEMSGNTLGTLLCRVIECSTREV